MYTFQIDTEKIQADNLMCSYIFILFRPNPCSTKFYPLRYYICV